MSTDVVGSEIDQVSWLGPILGGKPRNRRNMLFQNLGQNGRDY